MYATFSSDEYKREERVKFIGKHTALTSIHRDVDIRDFILFAT